MSEQELLDLPVSVPLAVAGRAFGMAPGKARELARSSEFPCRVIQVGARYRVPKSALLTALGLDRTGAAADTTAERPDDDHQMRKLRAIGG
jgi:hypothetical protein